MSVDKSDQAALETVTDYVAEKEVDMKVSETAMNKLKQDWKHQQAAKLERQKQLAAVTINPEDLKYIMNELELPEAKADRLLREHNGIVKNAVTYFINN